MARRVLFLCTGNYYRSRFAEVLFDALAVEAGLDWRADSRGLALTDANVGPISPLTLDGLYARGLPSPEVPRAPLAADAVALAAADLIVAVDEGEHRALLARLLPEWADRVVYWQVADVDRTPAATALATLEEAVRRLVAELAAGLTP